MLRKRFFALLAAATIAGALIPSSSHASTAAAAAPCQIKPLFQGLIEWHQDVLVVGAYNAPATALDVDLTCGIVRQGETVWSKTETLPLRAAAMTEYATVLAGTISPCYEVRVMYLERTTFEGNCP